MSGARAAPVDDRHVILVGLPGSGKSSVGVRLASRLERAFLDFDVEIERRTGLSVPQVFATWGERHFRELERQVTGDAGGLAPAVLAPGGGWIMHPETVAMIRPRSTLVWLMVTPREAARRLGSAAAFRPLLSGDPEARLEELLAERAAFYGSADETLDTEVLSVQGVVDQLALLAPRWGSGVG